MVLSNFNAMVEKRKKAKEFTLVNACNILGQMWYYHLFLSRNLFNLNLILFFHRTFNMPILLFVYLILYVPSTICQLCGNGSSWVEPVLSLD